MHKTVVLFALALLGCKRPSADVFAANRGEIEGWRTKLAPVYDEIGPKRRPVNEVGECSKDGLVKNTLNEAGNVELIGLNRLSGVAPRGKRQEGSESVEFGPFAKLLLWLDSDSTNSAPQERKALVDGSRRNQYLLVVRNAFLYKGYDVFLVDVSTASIQCSFAARVKDEPYDPKTGDPNSAARKAEREGGLPRILDEELKTRFRITTNAKALPPEPEYAVVARKRFATMVHNLAAATALPACTEPPVEGALQTTLRRLRAYAGLGPLAKDDLDTWFEAPNTVSQAWQDHVQRGLSEVDRRRHTERALAAPGYLVLDVEQLVEATPLSSIVGRGAATKRKHAFTPGRVTVRRVAFDRSGAATCQERSTLVNADSLKVTIVSGNLLMDRDLHRASEDDLLRQLEERFRVSGGGANRDP